MLQTNGIEDFRPLDVSLETKEDTYEGEKYQNGNDQISVSDSDNKDGGYNLRDMPEYNSETKADFKGNQEAIDWLMKDPNEFNVKSFEDSSMLEDTDNFSQDRYSSDNKDQDKTESNAQSNFHHRNDGSKRHQDMSVKDSTKFGHGTSHSDSVQDYEQDEDGTQLPSNYNNAQSSRHLGKTTEWKDNYDNFQDSEYSENDNMGQGQKSWDSISDDGTSDRSYDENDKDSETYNEQSPQASSMKNLNKQIKNQDAKLYKELENYANIDNYENADNLGNFDVHGNDFENHGNKYEDMEDQQEESNSDSEDNNSMSNGKMSDHNQQEGDRGRNIEWKDDESTHTSQDQSDAQNSDEDTSNGVNSNEGDLGSDNEDNKSAHAHGKMMDEKDDSSDLASDNEDNKSAHGKMTDDSSDAGSDNKSAHGKMMDETDDSSDLASDNEDNKSAHGKMMDETDDTNKESTNAKNSNGDQEIVNIKTDHASGNDKLKEPNETHNNGNNNNLVIQNSHSLTSEVKNIDKSQEERIVNKGKGTQTISYNEKEVLDNSKTTLNSKNENEKHIPTDNVGNYEGITSASPKADSVKKPSNGETNVIQHSNSGTKRVPDSLTKVIDEIRKVPAKNTAEESLTLAQQPGSHDNDKQQLIYKNVKDIQKDLEQKLYTKLYVALKKTTRNEDIKTEQNNGKTSDYRNGKKQTSTGFRRNQPGEDPSPRIYSLADITKMENIISYLRGAVGPRSVPTRSSRYTPTSVSLKSLYYYPIHPTPQDQNDDVPGVKGKGVDTQRTID